MRGKKLVLLGLLATVTALLALIASATNAETNAKWLILDKEGKAIDANNLHSAIGVSLEKNDGALLTRILGVDVKILCTSMTVIGGALLGQGTIGEGKLKFSGCGTSVNGVNSAACTPHTTGTAAGTVETKFLSGLIVLHTLKETGLTDALLKVVPSEGTLLAKLETGEECAIGEEITVNGTVYLKDCCSLQMHLEKHLLEQGLLTELWVLKKTPEHLETSLEGSGLLFLTGTHLGLLFSGDPA